MEGVANDKHMMESFNGGPSYRSSSCCGASFSSSSTIEGQGPLSPIRKKRKIVSQSGGGKFKSSWDLPPYIAKSSKCCEGRRFDDPCLSK